MADLTGFRPEEHPDGMERTPLPAGTYVGVITDTQQRTSAAGNDYLELSLEITDGPHAKRKLWDRLNLWHPKEDVSDIAKRRLAQACRSLGISAPRDSSELHDKPIGIVVAVKTRRDTGDRVNEVNGYASIVTQTRRINSETVKAGVANALAGIGSKSASTPPADPGLDADGIPF